MRGRPCRIERDFCHLAAGRRFFCPDSGGSPIFFRVSSRLLTYFGGADPVTRYRGCRQRISSPPIEFLMDSFGMATGMRGINLKAGSREQGAWSMKHGARSTGIWGWMMKNGSRFLFLRPQSDANHLPLRALSLSPFSRSFSLPPT